MSGKGCRRMAEISARLYRCCGVCLCIRACAFVLDDRETATIMVLRKDRDVHRLSIATSKIHIYPDLTLLTPIDLSDRRQVSRESQ